MGSCLLVVRTPYGHAVRTPLRPRPHGLDPYDFVRLLYANHPVRVRLTPRTPVRVRLTPRTPVRVRLTPRTNPAVRIRYTDPRTARTPAHRTTTPELLRSMPSPYGADRWVRRTSRTTLRPRTTRTPTRHRTEYGPASRHIGIGVRGGRTEPAYGNRPAYGPYVRTDGEAVRRSDRTPRSRTTTYTNTRTTPYTNHHVRPLVARTAVRRSPYVSTPVPVLAVRSGSRRTGNCP